ncbi:KH domain-containing protein [Aerococcus agrisoli]|uniref:RNA-binding protein KhpB n=1 Tax=Aerococcus agrisoli TaxID=2487350 RepID=A0A3N4GCS9_9LACT|nr:RNA-binding cell elongation regulator Jag/EloR [Aerococcus agrisoli]RPA60609.1 KH domain-containing protein [Aerococcus agrisoli]
MKTEKFEATSVDAAVAKGLQLLHLTREDVTVQVIQEPKKGFLGIGAKNAVVALTYNEADVAVESEELLDFSTFRRTAPAEDEVSEEIVQNESVVEETIEAEPEVEASEVTTPATDEPSVETVEAPLEAMETPVENDEVIEADNEELSIEAEAVDATEQSEEDLVDADYRDVEYVASYIIDVLKAYLVDATINVEDRGREVIYNIQTEKKGLVIGKHGKIINSLETLAQVMTHQHVRPHVRVTVNVGNYRERRHEILTRLARKTADQVAKTKRPVVLEPLPATERKIIHAQLAKYSYISTHSEGNEPHRYLVVSYND